MFKKIRTAVKFRAPLYKIIKLVLTIWNAWKDKKIDKKEQEQIAKEIMAIIKSAIKLRG